MDTSLRMMTFHFGTMSVDQTDNGLNLIILFLVKVRVFFNFNPVMFEFKIKYYYLILERRCLDPIPSTDPKMEIIWPYRLF